MSLHVTDLVGFKHDPQQKTWMGAFLFGEFDGATSAEITDKHYELLPLAEIKKREELALAAGDPGAAHEYDEAGDAIQDTIDGKRATPNDLPIDFQQNLYSAQGAELFKVIDPKADVDWTEYFVAQKTAQVMAEFVPEGTQVDTIMANGLHETSKTAGKDGGYRVTAQTGEQYLVDTAKFLKIYDETDVKGVYAPKPDPRKVLELDRSVAFTAPWGGEMRIREGGVLINAGPTNIYGIQPDEYKASYTHTPAPPKFQ